jgi:hypothetical protein
VISVSSLLGGIAKGAFLVERPIATPDVLW